MTARSRRIRPGQSRSESIRVDRQSRARTFENPNRSHPTESDRIKPPEMGCTSSKSEFLRVRSSRCEFFFVFWLRGNTWTTSTNFDLFRRMQSQRDEPSGSVQARQTDFRFGSDLVRPNPTGAISESQWITPDHSVRVGVAKRVCHRKFTKQPAEKLWIPPFHPKPGADEARRGRISLADLRLRSNEVAARFSMKPSGLRSFWLCALSLLGHRSIADMLPRRFAHKAKNPLSGGVHSFSTGCKPTRNRAC
jgi:hypothetical protein